MPKVFLARLLAVGGVFLAVWALPRSILLYATIATAFAHYTTAFLFSPARTRWFLTSGLGLGAAAMIALLSVAITKLNFPNWALYGIFHYLTSDVRVSTRPPLAGRGFWLSFGGRLIVNGLSAAVMFRKDLGLGGGPLFVAAWIAGLFVLAVSLWKEKPRVALDEWASLAGFEALVAGLTFFSLFHPITFAQASLAHFLFWAFLVGASLVKGGAEPVANFAGTFLAIAFVVYLLSPVGLFPSGWSQSTWMQAWSYGSNFHITASFLMTAAAQTSLARWFSFRLRTA